MPRDLRPFPRWGEGFGGEPVPAPPEPSFELDLRRREKLAVAVWYASLFATSLVATLVIVHRAVSASDQTLPTSYLLRWATVAGATLLLLTVLAGFSVFTAETAWHVGALFAAGGGLPVALGYWFGIAGQMDSGSALCGNGPPCDLSWGFGAAALAVAAALVVATVFGAVFGIKKIARRT